MHIWWFLSLFQSFIYLLLLYFVCVSVYVFIIIHIYIYDICIYSSMLLCLQLFLVICSGAMISKVGAEFLLPPQPIPAESHPTHRGAAVQRAKVDLRTSCENLGGLGARRPPCTLKSHPDLGIWVSQEAQFWTRFRHLKMLADVVCMWGPLGSILGTSGSILTSCCMLGPRWRELGDVLLHVGPTVAPCWPIFAKSDSYSPHLGRPRSQYPLCDPFCLCHRCFGYLKPSYLLITKIKKSSSDPPTPS